MILLCLKNIIFLSLLVAEFYINHLNKCFLLYKFHTLVGWQEGQCVVKTVRRVGVKIKEAAGPDHVLKSWDFIISELSL